jgi:hypothetical protein
MLIHFKSNDIFYLIYSRAIVHVSKYFLKYGLCIRVWYIFAKWKTNHPYRIEMDILSKIFIDFTKNMHMIIFKQLTRYFLTMPDYQLINGSNLWCSGNLTGCHFIVIVIPAIYSDEEYLIIQLCQTKLKSSWGIIWFDWLETIWTLRLSVLNLDPSMMRNHSFACKFTKKCKNNIVIQ